MWKKSWGFYRNLQWWNSNSSIIKKIGDVEHYQWYIISKKVSVQGVVQQLKKTMLPLKNLTSWSHILAIWDWCLSQRKIISFWQIENYVKKVKFSQQQVFNKSCTYWKLKLQKLQNHHFRSELKRELPKFYYQIVKTCCTVKKSVKDSLIICLKLFWCTYLSLQSYPSWCYKNRINKLSFQLLQSQPDVEL